MKRIGPDEALAIAAQLYVEMLKNGYTAVAEFHYLHHRPDGQTLCAVGGNGAGVGACGAEHRHGDNRAALAVCLCEFRRSGAGIRTKNDLPRIRT